MKSMKRLFHNRIRVLAAISLILLGSVAETRAGRVYCASEFHRYFKGLQAADARVNPVERFMFSLLLVQAKPQGQAPCLAQARSKQL